MPKREGDVITLGSGKMYYEEFTDAIPTFEAVKALCVEEKRLALIKGGAALEYKEDTHVEQDDLGIVQKIITVKEEVKLKGGLLTWTGNTLGVLIDRSKVTEEAGVRVTKIGGAGNAKGKYYVLVFHHEDEADGDLWVVIVGRNTAGLSIKFDPEKGSAVEPEFTAKPHDKDGTLVVIYEELDTAA